MLAPVDIINAWLERVQCRWCDFDQVRINMKCNLLPFMLPCFSAATCPLLPVDKNTRQMDLSSPVPCCCRQIGPIILNVSSFILILLLVHVTLNTLCVTTRSAISFLTYYWKCTDRSSYIRLALIKGKIYITHKCCVHATQQLGKQHLVGKLWGGGGARGRKGAWVGRLRLPQ